MPQFGFGNASLQELIKFQNDIFDLADELKKAHEKIEEGIMVASNYWVDNKFDELVDVVRQIIGPRRPPFWERYKIPIIIAIAIILIAVIGVFMFTLRDQFSCNDDVVFYSGYTEEELEKAGLLEWLTSYGNVVIKFGRFLPNQESHYDEVLGVQLASKNQYAKFYADKADLKA